MAASRAAQPADAAGHDQDHGRGNAGQALVAVAALLGEQPGDAQARRDRPGGLIGESRAQPLLLLGILRQAVARLGMRGEVGVDLGSALGRQAAVEPGVQFGFFDRAGDRAHSALLGVAPRPLAARPLASPRLAVSPVGISAEKLAQTFAAARQARHHRTDRHGQHARRLVVRQILDPDEHQDRPLLLRQPGESPQQVAMFERFDLPAARPAAARLRRPRSMFRAARAACGGADH